MSDGHRSLWNAVEQSVLRADGQTPSSLRQAVASRGELPAPLAALVDKIHRHAYRVTDEDVTALRAHYSEDELFEIIVASAVGAATTRLHAGLRALEDA